MAQLNNRIILILSLGTGKVSIFRTVAAVKDRRYIQNNFTVFVWIVCWSQPRRGGKIPLWGVTLPQKFVREQGTG
jgi:hypothetical protein